TNGDSRQARALDSARPSGRLQRGLTRTDCPPLATLTGVSRRTSLALSLATTVLALVAIAVALAHVSKALRIALDVLIFLGYVGILVAYLRNRRSDYEQPQDS